MVANLFLCLMYMQSVQVPDNDEATHGEGEDEAEGAAKVALCYKHKWFLPILDLLLLE